MEKFVIFETIVPGVVNKQEHTVTVPIELMNSLLRIYSCNKYLIRYSVGDIMENVQDLKNALAVTEALEEEIKKLEKMFINSSETSGYKE